MILFAIYLDISLYNYHLNGCIIMHKMPIIYKVPLFKRFLYFIDV